jgi:hypothetical protein
MENQRQKQIPRASAEVCLDKRNVVIDRMTRQKQKQKQVRLERE